MNDDDDGGAPPGAPADDGHFHVVATKGNEGVAYDHHGNELETCAIAEGTDLRGIDNLLVPNGDGTHRATTGAEFLGIRSRPATREYRNGWDRIFGPKTVGQA